MEKRIAPEFFKNSFYNFISFLIAHFGGAVFTIIIARILNPDLFGVYSLAISIIFILMSFANLGINETLTRYVSLHFNNQQKAKAYFLYLFKIKIFLLIISSAILMIFSKLIASFYGKKELSYLLVIGAIFLFFYSMMQFVSSLFYAFKNIRAYVYKEFVFQVVRISLTPFLIILSFGYLSTGPVIIGIIGSIIGIIFSLIYLFKRYPYFFLSKKIEIDKKELFNFLKYLSLGSLSVIFLMNTDIIILGKFVDSEFIGLYNSSSSIVLLIASFLTLTSVLYPIFTQISKQKIKNIFNTLLYYSIILSIPMTMGSVILARFFIQLLFGEAYLLATIPLYVLAPLILFSPTGDLFAILLNSKGYSKITAKITLKASLINILLDFILIYLFLKIFQNPIYSLIGVGIATLISRSFILFKLSRISKKRFNVRIDYLLVIKSIIASIIMGIFLFYFVKLTEFNLLLTIIGIIFALYIYFIMMFLIKGISNKEINYIAQIFKDIFNEKKTYKSF